MSSGDMSDHIETIVVELVSPLQRLLTSVVLL